jgi:hypothetical protein
MKYIHFLLPTLVLLWIIAYMVTVYIKADDDKELYALFQAQLTPMSIVFVGLVLYAGICMMGGKSKSTYGLGSSGTFMSSSVGA